MYIYICMYVCISRYWWYQYWPGVCRGSQDIAVCVRAESLMIMLFFSNLSQLSHPPNTLTGVDRFSLCVFWAGWHFGTPYAKSWRHEALVNQTPWLPTSHEVLTVLRGTNHCLVMSFSCHFHVMFMSFSCHFHVFRFRQKKNSAEIICPPRAPVVNPWTRPTAGPAKMFLRDRGWDWCPNFAHHPTQKGI